MGIFLVCFAVASEEEIGDIIGEGRGKVKYFKPLPKKPTTADPERVLRYLSQTRLPRLSESDAGQSPQSRREFN